MCLNWQKPLTIKQVEIVEATLKKTWLLMHIVVNNSFNWNMIRNYVVSEIQGRVAQSVKALKQHQEFHLCNPTGCLARLRIMGSKLSSKAQWLTSGESGCLIKITQKLALGNPSSKWKTSDRQRFCQTVS